MRCLSCGAGTVPQPSPPSLPFGSSVHPSLPSRSNASRAPSHLQLPASTTTSTLGLFPPSSAPPAPPPSSPRIPQPTQQQRRKPLRQQLPRRAARWQRTPRPPFVGAFSRGRRMGMHPGSRERRLGCLARLHPRIAGRLRGACYGCGSWCTSCRGRHQPSSCWRRWRMSWWGRCAQVRLLLGSVGCA